MSAFPFQVGWHYYGVECVRGFDHKNEAVQEAQGLMGQPGITDVRTTYTNEDGDSFWVPEGCE